MKILFNKITIDPTGSYMYEICIGWEAFIVNKGKTYTFFPVFLTKKAAKEYAESMIADYGVNYYLRD